MKVRGRTTSGEEACHLYIKNRFPVFFSKHALYIIFVFSTPRLGLKLLFFNFTQSSLTSAVVRCGVLPNQENGQVSIEDPPAYRTLANYTCDDGFLLMGESSRTCQLNGLWSGMPPLCARKSMLTWIVLKFLSVCFIGLLNKNGKINAES